MPPAAVVTGLDIAGSTKASMTIWNGLLSLMRR
jgi:hypothetical protein